MSELVSDAYENERDDLFDNRRLLRRWRRFGVDADRHHEHDFYPMTVEREVIEVCACGQTKRRL
jgi:hypothetical protein